MTDLKSFIDVHQDSHFPIQNIPFGIFRTKNNKSPRAGTAIGDFVLDLSILENEGLIKFDRGEEKYFSHSDLNNFMSLGKEVCSKTRREIQSLLEADNSALRDNTVLKSNALIPFDEAEMLLPCKIGDYTDFYSSKEHATNVGIMFRGKENALMPNWVHLPIAYHGRSSSIVISGTNFRRPKGQTKADTEEKPTFGPSKLMDFELEMGFFIGRESQLGESININNAAEHIFGMVIVNDWSARDIQKWEYVPLGPFLGKNFATSISPWIVTLDALKPFRIKGPVQNPEPLPYLKNSGEWAYDIDLEIKINNGKLNKPFIISKTNFKFLYWNILQQLAHHTVNGCNVRTGDLMASGTISGEEVNSRGSMLELTWRGENPIKLPDGSERKFLQDGDEVIMSGYCQGNGYRIGFGEVKGKVLSA